MIILAWLLAAAIVSVSHRHIPEADWLMVHLLLLGAVSNALLIWSWHFTQAILRLPPVRHVAETARLAVFNGAVLLVMAGILTSNQQMVAVGAMLAAGAVIAHVITLVRALRRALPSRFAIAVRYYVAAACLAVPGVALGVALTRRESSGLLLAHVSIALLGWVGLPILGTLLTLWPTMLRTRIAAGAERDARRALPGLLVGIGILVAGLLLGLPWVAVVGVVIYTGAGGWVVKPLVIEMRQRRPASFAAWSTLAGVIWLAVGLAGFAVAIARGDPGGKLTAVAVVGGVLQVLLGSLSYLMPVVMGGGAAIMRARNARVDQALLARLVVANLGLALYVLPTPSAVGAAASVAVLGALLATGAMIVSSMLVTVVPADVGRGRRG